MGVGLPAEPATLIGVSVLTAVTAAGTTQGTATLIPASNISVTSASTATGVIFNSTTSLSGFRFVRVTPASTASAIVYPPTGGNFNGGATNAGITVPAGNSLIAYRLDTNNWVAWTSSNASSIAPASGQSVSPRSIAIGDLVPAVSTDFTDTAPVITEAYIGEILVPCSMTVTGIALFNGSNVTGNVKVGLYDSNGNLVAQSGSTAGSGTDAYQLVPFTATYAAVGPATYFIVSSYSSATARYNAPPLGVFGASKVTGLTFGTLPTTITPPTTFTANLCNIASLY